MKANYTITIHNNSKYEMEFIKHYLLHGKLCQSKFKNIPPNETITIYSNTFTTEGVVRYRING